MYSGLSILKALPSILKRLLWLMTMPDISSRSVGEVGMEMSSRRGRSDTEPIGKWLTSGDKLIELQTGDNRMPLAIFHQRYVKGDGRWR